MYAEPASGDPTLGRPRSAVGVDATTTDQFTIDGLKPGEYLLRVPARAGAFTIKSISMAGEDYTHRPFDPATARGLDDVVITFTDRITRIEGVVRDQNGPIEQAAVIAFPVERDQWRGYGFTPPRLVSTPIAGTPDYRIPALPAGDYFLIAVDSSLVSAWQTPGFLEKAAALATRVTLEWGDTKTVDLQLARIK